LKSKRFASCLLSALTALSVLAACAYNPENVMTVDGTEIKAGVYLYFQLTSALDDLAAEADDSAVDGKDLIEEDRIVSGTTARAYVEDETLKKIREYLFIEREYDRLGLSFTAYELSTYQSTIQTDWESYSSYYLHNGISYDTYEQIMLNTTYKKPAVQTALYAFGGEKEISKDELESYFNEHYTKYDYIQIPLTDVNGSALLTEFEELVLTKTKEMLAQANSGTLENAWLNVYPEIASMLGTADSETIDAETFSSTLMSGIITNDETTTPNEGLVKALFEVERDEEGNAIKDESYKIYHEEGVYLCIYRVLGLSEEEKYKDYETTLRSSMSAEPFEEYIKTSTAGWAVDIDSRAKKYYSMDKIKTS